MNDSKINWILMDLYIPGNNIDNLEEIDKFLERYNLQ